jgi:hypothetical protein
MKISTILHVSFSLLISAAVFGANDVVIYRPMNMDGNAISNLPNPVTGSHAATKEYVDAITNDLHATGLAPAGAAGGDLSGTYPNPAVGDSRITSAKIENGTIVDGDISASAAIAGIKVVSATTTSRGTVELATDGESAATLAVQANDSRLSNARTPGGSAGGALSGTYPNPTLNISNAGNGLTGGGGSPLAVGQGSGISVAADSVAVDSTVVRTTGNQTINGTKTFSSIPVLPGSNPTSANQAARKAYVDAQVSAIPVAKLDVRGTGDQMVLGYDNNKKTTVKINSTGHVEIEPLTSPEFIDQEQPNFNGGRGAGTMWQSFTPASSGLLTYFKWNGGWIGLRTITIRIYEGEGTGGTLIHEQRQRTDGYWIHTYLDAPVELTAGQTYTFCVLSAAQWRWQSGNQYAGGRSDYSTSYDYCFFAYMQTGTVANVGIGLNHPPTTKLDVFGNKMRIRGKHTPASATDSGYTGEVCWDDNYMYICIYGDGPGGGTDSWKRSPLSTW